MSDQSGLSSFPIRETDLPVEVASEQEASDVYGQLEASSKTEDPDRPYLIGFSRNGWFEHVMNHLLRNVSLESLAFLSGDAKPLNVSGRSEHVFALVPIKDVPRVLHDLHLLLDGARHNPEWLANASTIHTPDDVLDGLDASVASLNPGINEDGDDFTYFFSCIKMLQHIFQYAQTHECCVLHYILQAGRVKPDRAL